MKICKKFRHFSSSHLGYVGISKSKMIYNYLMFLLLASLTGRIIMSGFFSDVSIFVKDVNLLLVLSNMLCIACGSITLEK